MLDYIKVVYIYCFIQNNSIHFESCIRRFHSFTRCTSLRSNSILSVLTSEPLTFPKALQRLCEGVAKGFAKALQRIRAGFEKYNRLNVIENNQVIKLFVQIACNESWHVLVIINVIWYNMIYIYIYIYKYMYICVYIYIYIYLYDLTYIYKYKINKYIYG